jgi:hypothetical protein
MVSEAFETDSFSILKFRGYLLARVARVLWIVASKGAREAFVIRVTVVFTKVVCTQNFIYESREAASKSI